MYRIVKGGDSGLNLRLSDILDKYIEIPSLYEVIKSLFTKQPIIVKLKAFPRDIIEKLIHMQLGVDEAVQREIQKSKVQSGI